MRVILLNASEKPIGSFTMQRAELIEFLNSDSSYGKLTLTLCISKKSGRE